MTARLLRAVAALWILGGVLLAVAVAPYLWHADALAAVAVAAGALLVLAFVAGAFASRLAVVGALVMALGYLTVLLLIGFLLIPIGAALYVRGLGRAGARLDLLVLAFGVAVAAHVVMWTTTWNDVVPWWLGAAAAIAVGSGLACGDGAQLGRAPRRGERTT